ncbi:MAG: dienelactone hydrolase family protein [Cyclobacteriaceae bacterium]|nr:dienelactone hydrolase family protein [Cyclobacteriaceae bacterium]
MHNYDILERGSSLEKAKKAIICLHGRGATADGILQLGMQFANEEVYLAAPQATTNSWYPYSFMAPSHSNQPWLNSAIEVVKKLIDETSGHLGYENIYLMGFSQGACLTLEVAARYPMRYAGIASFTGGLIGEKLDTDKYKGDFKGTPVFIGNSDRDPHVPLQRSEESATLMENLGATVLLKIYEDMLHTIVEDEIQSVKKLMF